MTMNKEETNSKRGFFCSSRYELFDDEYYDEQLLEKKRRLTPQQVNLLDKTFETQNKVEAEHKTQLPKKLGLQPMQVAVWFQNRRARWKTKQLERDYHQLKSTYDSLLSQYDSNIKHNDKLKAEVVLLSEKLQAKALSQEAMPIDDYYCCIGLMDTDVVHSEEDDGGSDDGGSYLSRVIGG